MTYIIKSEEEIRKKRDEAGQREQRENEKIEQDNGNPAEKEYCSMVYQILDWVLGEGDDPFIDSEPL